MPDMMAVPVAGIAAVYDENKMLREEVEALRAELASLKVERDAAFAAGEHHGRGRAMGEILARCISAEKEG